MRSQFNSPTQPPEHPIKQGVASLLKWATIVAVAGLALCLLLGPFVLLADLLLAREWTEPWAQVSAGFLLLLLLSVLPKRIRTAPAKALLLSIATITVAHALYVSLMHQQGPLAVPRTLMILWGLTFLWKALDLYHEHMHQPAIGSIVFAAVSLVSGCISLGLAALYAYPIMFDLTVEQLQSYPFPTLAFMTYMLINILHPDQTTTKNVSRNVSP
jgi:hypothetical protein